MFADTPQERARLPGDFPMAMVPALPAPGDRDATAQSWPIQFPALAALPLADDDRAAFECQGFVQAEKRGERTVFKLRYRVHAGKSCVAFPTPRPRPRSRRNSPVSRRSASA